MKKYLCYQLLTIAAPGEVNVCGVGGASGVVAVAQDALQLAGQYRVVLDKVVIVGPVADRGVGTIAPVGSCSLGNHPQTLQNMRKTCESHHTG